MFKGYETGAVDFLYKPIEPHILRNKADVFFQLSRQKQQLAHELRDRTETLRLNEMFTAVLGHDLRNPLNAILTAAQLLEHRSTDEAVRKTAARMMSSAKRMSRLIEDMLDLARARLAGGIPLKRERGDLGALVHRVVQEHQEAFPERRIEVLVEGDLDGRVGRRSPDPGRLQPDRQRAAHGEPSAPVQVRVDGTSADLVTLAVTSGGRIAADVLPHIFDPFRGGQRAVGRNEGLGLGLYIVQQIVQAHHGDVEVQSDDATVFLVKVPRSAAEVVKL